MNLLNKFPAFFVKNPQRVIVLIVILLLIVVSSILYLNYSETIKQSSINSVGSNLKNYDPIRQKIGALVKDDEKNISPTNKDRIKERLVILEDKKTTPEQAYTALQEIALFVGSAYSETNDPKYKKLGQEIGDFTKLNFPNLYNKFDFEFVCQDTECAESPQPQEILNILDEIKKSDLPQEIKDNLIMNIKNTGYLPESRRFEKASLYSLDLSDIERYASLSESGATGKIYSMLELFLEKNYPEEYDVIKNIPEATPPPFKKE